MRRLGGRMRSLSGLMIERPTYLLTKSLRIGCAGARQPRLLLQAVLNAPQQRCVLCRRLPGGFIRQVANRLRLALSVLANLRQGRDHLHIIHPGRDLQRRVQFLLQTAFDSIRNWPRPGLQTGNLIHPPGGKIQRQSQLLFSRTGQRQADVLAPGFDGIQ